MCFGPRSCVKMDMSFQKLVVKKKAMAGRDFEPIKKCNEFRIDIDLNLETCL